MTVNRKLTSLYTHWWKSIEHNYSIHTCMTTAGTRSDYECWKWKYWSATVAWPYPLAVLWSSRCRSPPPCGSPSPLCLFCELRGERETLSRLHLQTIHELHVCSCCKHTFITESNYMTIVHTVKYSWQRHTCMYVLLWSRLYTHCSWLQYELQLLVSSHPPDWPCSVLHLGEEVDGRHKDGVESLEVLLCKALWGNIWIWIEAVQRRQGRRGNPRHDYTHTAAQAVYKYELMRQFLEYSTLHLGWTSIR